ncbi:hypothetical protein TTHERM_00637790 (macronuclear) [Tetrahymena thermophila SB210]|uniref:Uncharacterized protein n=1 Tax=Tetrahymena thermophila (strain SB210) TaxID=312017 RepID=Q22HC4_TETTS|nr:hypothetical protein TTHERM_00637790 [Tetrahymena thermophila SB210]EAR84777.1 hypothetical protein TTHERM_00637790 [Tetrahymena thermophila SB210]|eukprot:XP_001032440.1 hypothetical protein TTHERM_00637790 [Tetrahymena thermophila SB210]
MSDHNATHNFQANLQVQKSQDYMQNLDDVNVNQIQQNMHKNHDFSLDDQFQHLGNYEEQNIIDFQDNFGNLLQDHENNWFQNYKNSNDSDEIYFHNVLNNKSQAIEKNYYQQSNQNNLQEEEEEIAAKQNIQNVGNTKSHEEQQQTQRYSLKDIQEYILNNPEYSKKYKKKIACPQCVKANLQAFEINKEESLFMCTNVNCSFPFESNELHLLTFQTKFKKRVFTKIKNYIQTKYDPSIEIYFDEEDVSAVIKQLEQYQEK